jgi:hypothetical protein
MINPNAQSVFYTFLLARDKERDPPFGIVPELELRDQWPRFAPKLSTHVLTSR